ncbi:hypothetical protein N9Z01_02090 [Flavobacteriaceae bacterium]|nr:hypothetical protein [Flavobacteriaceae bacterium]
MSNTSQVCSTAINLLLDNHTGTFWAIMEINAMRLASPFGGLYAIMRI